MICTLRGRERGKYEACKYELGDRKVMVPWWGGSPFCGERKEREKEMGRESSTLGSGKKNTSLKPLTGELK